MRWDELWFVDHLDIVQLSNKKIVQSSPQLMNWIKINAPLTPTLYTLYLHTHQLNVISIVKLFISMWPVFVFVPEL